MAHIVRAKGPGVALMTTTANKGPFWRPRTTGLQAALSVARMTIMCLLFSKEVGTAVTAMAMTMTVVMTMTKTTKAKAIKRNLRHGASIRAMMMEMMTVVVLRHMLVVQVQLRFMRTHT